ncbi:MAG: 50S ribosomal protein L19 [Kiritimatiellae bacterium]|nr:50S ribosomal protein L19 [Kiritimatiellia bacterium]MBQ6329946.1 50S ribosomal protein L19 [Kiritimatiellia bacterium]
MGIKLIDKINAEQTAALAGKNFPAFRAGDIVRVSIKIKEGDKFRIQDFEGKVLAVDNGRGNVAGNFTVSRDSYGVRVEKLFPFNSPWLQAIKLVKKGTARRAKLYNERTFCSHKAVRKLVKR